MDIFNPDNNRHELEPCLSLVLQLADGQHTIEELYYYLSLSGMNY